MATVRTCTLTLTSTPPEGTGWGVQFSRRRIGPNAWLAHGTRDASAPFTRSAAVAAGGWDTRAVWTRTGSATVETFRTAECH